MIEKIKRIKKFRLLEKHKKYITNITFGINFKSYSDNGMVYYTKFDKIIFTKDKNQITYHENYLPICAYLRLFKLEKETLEIILEDIL